MAGGEGTRGSRRRSAADRHRAIRIAELQDRLDDLEQRHAVQWEDPVALLDRVAVLLEDDHSRPVDRRERVIALVDEAIELLEAELQPA